jgi:hypothetical protein
VLYALRYPLSFAVLVVTFVVGLTVRGVAQRLVSGERRPAWARTNAKRRRGLGLWSYIDAYGCIAAAIGGLGWGTPVDITDPRAHSRGRRVVQVLIGPVVLGGLGVGLLAIFKAWADPRLTKPLLPGLGSVVTGSAFVDHPSLVHYHLKFGQVALFLAGVELLAMGVLAIMPLPPLDGGKLLFTLAPRSPGWQKARFRLDEENWGLLLLLFFAVPVLFRQLVLVTLIAKIVNPLIGLIA